jgi:hypothetical protein
MADVPRLDNIAPGSARAGAQLTLTGAAFGARTGGSAIRFRLPRAGAAPVPGPIVDWAAGTIHARVPALASFGSGGPLEVSVHADAGDSAPLNFVLEEDAPPSIGAANPPRGLAGAEITLTGDRFGRQTPSSAVLFQAPGPAEVEAEIVSWAPAAITAKVPSLTALGGAGQRPIVVRTPWGRSAATDFLVGELPQVTAVTPPSPAPSASITVTGRAFGAQATGQLRLVAVYETEDPNAPANETILAPHSWTDTEIRATLPDFRVLRTTGPREVIVTSEWGESIPDQRSRILIESRASITSWTRVEPHARTSNLEAGLALGLQAQVYDALWLLGRQWQLLELEGEDAGSPVAVEVAGSCKPLARWLPHGGQAQDVPAGVPLEAMAERERVFPPLGGARSFGDLRLAAEAGLQLLRIIDARLRNPAKSDDYRKRFLREYPLTDPADVGEVDAGSRRFLAVATGRVPDGSRIYADFQVALGENPQLPRRPPIDGNDRANVLAAVREWYTWCGELFSEPVPDQSAWDAERMEYSFAAGSGGLVLDAREHDGGHLDWYSFTRRAPGSTLGQPPAGRGPRPFGRAAIPNPISYPGMPVPRWWEIEDAHVDFGAVAAAPSELLKLVLIEFATVYGNDWFSVPLDAMPVGSLCEIDSVTVTDAFGDSISLEPFGDGEGSDWRMFELATDDESADAGHALLLLDALPATQESTPAEEVLLLRDELMNIAWAVEKTVQSPTGRALDRHENEVARRSEPDPPSGQRERHYLLQTPVPRNWIPLLPKLERDDDTGAILVRRLARGAIRDPDGGAPVAPRGRILEPQRPLDLYEEEVPRVGVRLTRVWTLGRGSDGSTHLWRGRRKNAGRGEGSSGLRFDSTDGQS